MFDGEIAATLLNRWDRKVRTRGDQSPLDLLEEASCTSGMKAAISTHMVMKQTGVFSLNA